MTQETCQITEPLRRAERSAKFFGGYDQWWKQDQNVNTKTKTSPVKQQQNYTTEKSLLLEHACLLSKNNFVQKRQKSDEQ